MSKKMDRRNFLKLAGTTAFAVSVTSVLGGCSEAPDAPSSSSPSASPEPPAPSSSGSSSSSSDASSTPDVDQSKIIWTTRNNDDGTAVLTGYDSNGVQPMGVITLPEKWSGRKIVELYGNLGGKITKMIVPGCYKKVHYGGSKYLEELILNEGVENVYEFDGSTNLRNVQLPSTIKSIGYKAFLGCTSLTSINLPEGLEALGWHAFSETGLTNIVVPSTVTDYNSYSDSAPFYDCKNLVSATVKGSVLSQSMFEACPKLKSVSLNDTILELPYKIFRDCSVLPAITLPKNLKKLHGEVFNGCKAITSINIPETVSEIDEKVFSRTSIQKVILPSSLKKIVWGTFDQCSILQAIYIPISVNTIEDYAFNECPLLKDVYYQSGEAQWVYISISDTGNTMLKAANMHYYSTPNSLR